MRAFMAISRDLVRLFVDDGGLALAVIVIVVSTGVMKFVIHVDDEIVGATLAFGCLAALIESVARASGKSRGP